MRIGELCWARMRIRELCRARVETVNNLCDWSPRTLCCPVGLTPQPGGPVENVESGLNAVGMEGRKDVEVLEVVVKFVLRT